MSRSIWKRPFSEKTILKKVYFNKENKKAVVIWSKNSTIFPTFLGVIFSVYDGKKFINLQINENMIGHKFGEFIQTRKKVIHKKK